MARHIITVHIILHALTFFVLWTCTTAIINERIEQPFRHPDCPLIDDPMHPIQLPYPNDCRKYYTCKNGYAYAMLCQNELHWSIITYRCDYPVIAKCSNAQYNPAVYPNDPTANGAYPIVENAIYKRDPTDCNKFYKCMPIRCPPLQYWNPLLERCDSPQNILCEASSNSVWTQSPNIDNALPTAATPPSFSQETPKPKSTEIQNNNLNALCSTPGVEYIRHPYDCHKFIQCDGIATIHTCANDLYWNSKIMACDRHCV